MKIATLVFENAGCCAGDLVATVLHDNGLLSRVVFDADEMCTYSVVTYSGTAIFIGQQAGMSEAEANDRLLTDASVIF